jgi:hypothetical protein
MEHRTIGGLLILAGLGLVVVGLIAWVGGLSWFGRLPGDIRIERDNFRVYVPFISMIIVSLVLTAVFWVIRRFF